MERGQAHPRNGSKAEMKTARICPGSRIRQRTPKLCRPHSGLLVSRNMRSASQPTDFVACVHSKRFTLS